MADYKSMYYFLAGRMASAVDTLEATTEMLESNAKLLEANAKSLAKVKEKLKLAQQVTEEMFISSEDDYSGDDSIDEA